ncbi:MAG TPA: hypothetical protein VGE26_09750 [Sphingobacteriaceae bacterium]
MKKIIILTILLLVATVSIAYFYFSNLSLENNKNEKVVARIPSDAGMVLEFTSDKTFYEIFKDYKLFAEIVGQNNQARLEQLRNKFHANAQLASFLDQQKIYLSFHHEKKSVQFLWLARLTKPLSQKDLEGHAISIKASATGQYYQVSLDSIPDPFYLFIDGDLATGSFSKALLERSTGRDGIKISREFVTLISNTTARSENALLNLYIDHKRLLPFIEKFYRKEMDGNYTFLNNMVGYSALNMNFNSDAIMFNGITDLDTNTTSYFRLFLPQKSTKTTLQRIIPLSTANFVQFNLSDHRRFESDLRELFNSRKELKVLTEQIATVSKQTGINPERDIKALWANEFIVFQTANHERYGAVKLKDGRKLQFLLEPLSEAVSHEFRRLRYSNILYYYFGDAFKAFKRPYFLIADNYLVFANSAAALRNYQKDYHKENFLYKTLRYTTFEQLLPDEATISLFIHNGNSRSITKSHLRPAYASRFAGKQGLRNFYGLSYKLSSDKDHFFTNLYIGYKQEDVSDFSADSLFTDTSINQQLQQ